MAIDGYIIKMDYTQRKKLAAAVSRVASNISQIYRRINSTGYFYADDIAALAGTIGYEIVCGITARVPRVAVNA